MTGKKAFAVLAVTIALSFLGAAPAADGSDHDRGRESYVVPYSLVASSQPSIGRPTLNLSPPLAHRDVVICSDVSKNVICNGIAHAYRPLPRPIHM